MIFFTKRTPCKGASIRIACTFLLLLSLIVNNARASAANHLKPFAFEVSGTVTSETGEVLVGVTVSEKGTTNGVSTDVNGKFKLNVRDGNTTLVVRYIGFQTKEVPVNNSAVINIT